MKEYHYIPNMNPALRLITCVREEDGIVIEYPIVGWRTRFDDDDVGSLGLLGSAEPIVAVGVRWHTYGVAYVFDAEHDMWWGDIGEEIHGTKEQCIAYVQDEAREWAKRRLTAVT